MIPDSAFKEGKPVSEEGEAARLAVTVAQLEHALTARVRVEQAIGVLAERHRLRPRQAFDLLRNVARSGGRRVIEIAETVVDSASNPLLTLPEELARKQPPARKRGRSPRHARAASERLRWRACAGAAYRRPRCGKMVGELAGLYVRRLERRRPRWQILTWSRSVPGRAGRLSGWSEPASSMPWP